MKFLDSLTRTATTRRLWKWAAALAVCLWPAAAMAGAGDASEPSVIHRTMCLVIQVGIIIFAAKLGSILFEKIKLPGVLGELAAGVLIGPYALGGLGFYGFREGLFPLPGGQFPLSPELYGISAIAAIVLLFNVGLETNLKMLLRYAFAGGLVALGGVVVSFFLGALAVKLFAGMLFGQSVDLFAPACMFMGAVSTATSVGITARILSEKRKLDSPEGVTVLSAAVIDDVLSIILLAVVTSIVAASKAGGINWGHTGIVAVRAVAVWLAATALGLVATRKISFVLKWFGRRTSIAIMALGMALVVGGLFQQVGLAMIIGAYVMGLSLSQADISHVIRERLSSIYALLVPIFFCTTGMMISLGSLASERVLIFGAVYSALALAAKVVGCGIPALFANFNFRGAARIGFAMMPRGEVGLIVAGVGLASGVVSHDLFAAAIMMVAVNTLLAPPVMLLLFRSPAEGTRRPERPGKAQGSTFSFDFPNMAIADSFVHKLVEVFESEGFFVHQLAHEPALYQMRKDHTVIEILHTGATLEFRCTENDLPLLNAGVYEAIAALEETIRQMRQPLAARSMSARIQADQAASGPPVLNMREYLTPRLIEPRLKGTAKKEIIDELLALLVRNRLLSDVQSARQAVLEREESTSTGLQYGVAIPHGKTDAVDRLVCAVGLKREGVEFNSMDGQPATIVILTLSPKSKPAPHIQFMSTVSQILSAEGRNRILASRTAEQVYKVFTTPPPP